ncbi:MAG: LysM peptidoglycan-binding domain-containing protein [Brevibacillus sp.]|nr:LysM peptidoglycan-binding domain-containing protein [Brevibacillus sp.]
MKIHIVQEDDTMRKIAKQYGVDMRDLLRVNSEVQDPDRLTPGVKIKIPVRQVPLRSRREQMEKDDVPARQLNEVPAEISEEEPQIPSTLPRMIDPETVEEEIRQTERQQHSERQQKEPQNQSKKAEPRVQQQPEAGAQVKAAPPTRKTIPVSYKPVYPPHAQKRMTPALSHQTPSYYPPQMMPQPHGSSMMPSLMMPQPHGSSMMPSLMMPQPYSTSMMPPVMTPALMMQLPPNTPPVMPALPSVNIPSHVFPLPLLHLPDASSLMMAQYGPSMMAGPEYLSGYSDPYDDYSKPTRENRKLSTQEGSKAAHRKAYDMGSDESYQVPWPHGYPAGNPSFAPAHPGMSSTMYPPHQAMPYLPRQEVWPSWEEGYEESSSSQ